MKALEKHVRLFYKTCVGNVSEEMLRKYIENQG